MEEPRVLAKPDLVKRFVAVIIDVVVGVLLALIPFVGALLAAVYWLVRDGLDIDFMDHRSVGKKLVKLRPVMLDGSPVDLLASVKRNFPLVVSAILWPLLLIPVLGWILILILVVPVALVSVALLIIELVLILTDDKGRRWGDRLANTQVIESP